MTPPRHSLTPGMLGAVSTAVCWLLVVIPAGSTRAADAQVKSFDIPAETGDRALKRFSVQSGVEVVFGTATAAQVKTNAVKGDFAPRAAIALLLEGTGLVVLPNEKTGALTVSRSPNGKKPGDHARDSQKKNMTETPQTQEPMKRNKLIARLTAALALLAAPIEAQVAQQEESDPEVVTLSPFTVEATEDQGYRATNTLAGTRIRTNLRDIGASIAVVTEEFMDDLSATDGEGLLSYIGNVEVGGPQGNFANANLAAFSTEESRVNPQRGQRIRGLSSATTMRDYFQTDIPFDSYNTDRVDVNRGPNSVLFGLGSPGGVINNSTIRASTFEDFREVSVRLDAEGGNRETVDINEAIIKDRLGVRIAAMNEDLRFRQEPASETDRRGHLSATLMFKNEKSNVLGRTTLRGSFERGKIDRNPPDVVVPIDSFSVWWEGVGDQEAFNRILRTPGMELRNVTGGLASFGSQFSVIPATRQQVLSAINAGLATVPNGLTPDQYVDTLNLLVRKTTVDRFAASNPASLQRGGAKNMILDTAYFAFPAISFTSYNAEQPGFNDPALNGIDGFMGRFRPRGFGTQDTLWTFNPFEDSPLRAFGWEQQSIANDKRQVFDPTRTLLQGRTNFVKTDFDIAQIVLEQELFNGKAGIELAYDRQEKTTRSFLPHSRLESKTINIDVMEYHPAGDQNLDGIPDRLPNENLGRPVVPAVEEDDNISSSIAEQETYRLTAFGRLDFRDFVGNKTVASILGRHTLSGVYEDRTNEVRTMTIVRDWWSDTAPKPTSGAISGGLNNAFTRGVRWQTYVGPSALNLERPEDLRIDGVGQGINVPLPKGGDSYGVWIWDNGEQTDKKAVWEVIDAIGGANRQKTRLKSRAFTLQSAWFNNHLNTMVGYRTDSQKVFRRLQSNTNLGDPSQPGVRPLRIDLPGDNRVDGNFNLALLDGFESEPASVTGDVSTLTYSVVGRFPEQRLFELPLGMDLTLHYFKSESFVPGGLALNVVGDRLGDPSGKTEEFGATVSFFEDRFSIRVSKFKTTLANERTGGMNGQLGRIASQPGQLLQRLVEGHNAGVPLFPSESDRQLTPDTSPDNGARLTGTDADLAGVSTWEEYFDTVIGLIPPQIQQIANWRVERQENGQLLAMRDPFPGSLNATQDLVADGVEIDLVGSLTDNITIQFNAAQQKTVLANIAPTAIPLAFDYWENLNAPLPDSPGGWSYAQLRMNTAVGTGQLAGTEFAEAIREFQVQMGKDGRTSQEQREWRVNAVLKYDFTHGMLDGLSLGGAARWQSRVAGGFRNKVIDGQVLPDIDSPIFGPDELFGDFFASYRRKLTDKVTWRIQLNIRNLYRSEGDDFVPVSFNPDGAIAVSRIPNERQFFLTNTFSF